MGERGDSGTLYATLAPLVGRIGDGYLAFRAVGLSDS